MQAQSGADQSTSTTSGQEANRTGYLPHADLANLYGHLDRFDEARMEWAKVKEIIPTMTVAGW